RAADHRGDRRGRNRGEAHRAAGKRLADHGAGEWAAWELTSSHAFSHVFTPKSPCLCSELNLVRRKSLRLLGPFYAKRLPRVRAPSPAPAYLLAGKNLRDQQLSQFPRFSHATTFTDGLSSRLKMPS